MHTHVLSLYRRLNSVTLFISKVYSDFTDSNSLRDYENSKSVYLLAVLTPEISHSLQDQEEKEYIIGSGYFIYYLATISPGFY